MEYEPISTVVNGVCAEGGEDGSGKLDAGTVRRLALELNDFTWEALEEEAARLGVSIEELARFAVLYYLADRDSGRIARRLPAPPELGGPHPLGKLLGT